MARLVKARIRAWEDIPDYLRCCADFQRDILTLRSKNPETIVNVEKTSIHKTRCNFCPDGNASVKTYPSIDGGFVIIDLSEFDEGLYTED